MGRDHEGERSLTRRRCENESGSAAWNQESRDAVVSLRVTAGNAAHHFDAVRD
ncbi:MAG: hypothetical protein KGO50_17815 [Myxococcales bacterium]|nr:hypothetical protein [Myxococcales bacterium]